MNPEQKGSVRLGGISNRAPPPAMLDKPLAGGLQTVEFSHGGKRVHCTNSLYGVRMTGSIPMASAPGYPKRDADPNGGLRVDASVSPIARSFAASVYSRSGCGVASFVGLLTALADSAAPPTQPPR